MSNCSSRIVFRSLGFGFVLLLIGTFARAQRPDSLRAHSLMINPLYGFKGGIRADYAFRYAPYRALTSGIEFYHRSNSKEEFPYLGTYEFRNLTGYGLNTGYKLFLPAVFGSNEWQPVGSYLGTNLLFQHYFATFPDDFGLNYPQQTWRLGLDFILGYQDKAADRVVVGFYGGVGVRKSWHYAQEGVHHMSKLAWEYGFNGIALIVGFQFGLLL